jgi:hypothetical protein
MSLQQPLAAEIPHLLEWHASYCATLAESSKRRRTQLVLRLLAVDLTIQAEKSRWRHALPAATHSLTAAASNR